MKKGIFILLAIFVLMGCSKKQSDTPDIKPSQAELSAPAQNAVCTNGTILSVTQSTISFSWNASNNTDSYNLIVKNLLTSDSTVQNTTQTQAPVTLLRNTPYSWYIVSKSTKTTVTARSPVWKFYNSGPGVVTYAPFPAELTSPGFAQLVNAGTINLTWKGSVVVPDVIASYDVYFGTTNSPAIKASAISDSFLNNITVAASTTYYWKVITRDTFGNTSDSGLYQFTVN
jgi:hypothetical protein